MSTSKSNLFKQEILQQGNALRNCYQNYLVFNESDGTALTIRALLGFKNAFDGLDGNADILSEFQTVAKIDKNHVISPLGALLLNLYGIILDFIKKSGNLLMKSKINFRIFAIGMGTSLFSAIPAKYKLPGKIMHEKHEEQEIRGIPLDFEIIFSTQDAGEFQYLPFYKELSEQSINNKHRNDCIIPITLLISQSGESGEIIQILEQLEKNNFSKKQIWALTNDVNSTLANSAGLVLPLFAGEELTVTNKTYLCQLLIINIISEILPIFLKNMSASSTSNTNNTSPNDELRCILNTRSLNKALGAFQETFSKKVRELIKAVNSLLDKFDYLQQSLYNFLEFSQQSSAKPINYIAFIAKGPSLATAHQAALNTKEVAKVPAEALSGGMFRHGPIEIINEQFRSVLISSIEEGAKNLHKMAQNITNKWIDIEAGENTGGKVIVIANKSHLKELSEQEDFIKKEYQKPEFNAADISIFEKERIFYILHTISDPYLAPIIEIIPIQALFFGLALNKGITPGTFKYSSKITKRMNRNRTFPALIFIKFLLIYSSPI